MGFGITAVCTVAAYSSRLTMYDSTVLIPFWTGIVNGGNCSVTLDTFTGDAGSLIEVFNITTPGQMQVENIHCNISSSLGCNTNYFTFNGLPYEQITFDFYALNASGLYNAVNWTYFILPPVPSQPPPAVVNSGTQVIYTTSQYSSEYGAALIGCVVAAGPYQWSPPAGTFPATLSSTPSQNSLPNTSATAYAPAQNSNITVNLADMNLAPNTVYDFWVVCYNSNGASPASVRFNQTSSSSLPTPTPTPTPAKNSAAGVYVSAFVSAMMAGVTWCLVAAVW